MLYEHIGGLLFYMRDLIFVCKVLMKGSHNLSTNVNVKKNVRRQLFNHCKYFFPVNFQNNQVN
jgi:hypothetical protein